MRAYLQSSWQSIRASYWFLPFLISGIAIVASLVAVLIDGRLGADWLPASTWWFALNKPDGARTLLSTIAGSMISVAGVTFSITIAALAFTSGQFGPRILTNFLRDRSNQFTLGVLIGTYLYCLMVLRTIRSGDETSFVPHISVFIALLLALLSIGVLIRFIHNITTSIHVSNIMAGIGHDLLDHAKRQFPDGIGQDYSGSASHEASGSVDFGDGAAGAAIDAKVTGYVQAISATDLLSIASEHDLVVTLVCRPGDFVVAGQPFAFVRPAEQVAEDVLARLQSVIATGEQRTPDQDTDLLVEQLVEMAARALSPGINDPFTANACLNWLGGYLIALGRTDTPDALRADMQGHLRVVARPVTFEEACHSVFGALRSYFAPDPNAALHMARIIALVTSATHMPEGRTALLGHARALAADAEDRLSFDRDREALGRRVALIERLAAGAPETAALDIEKELDADFGSIRTLGEPRSHKPVRRAAV